MPNISKDILLRKLERESLSRIETEEILERVTLELYDTNKRLQEVLDKNNTLLNKYKDELVLQNRVNSKLVDENVIYSSTDLKGVITEVSQAFCDISGFTKDELIGSSHKIVRHPDMPSSVYEELWKTIKQDKIWKGEIKNKKKDGSFYWLEAIISPKYNLHGQKVGYSAVRKDITNRKYIEKISITDSLTGLYNRRHFNKISSLVLDDLKRNNDFFCFLMMDIDHFKKYNDNYGHQMGDEALIKVSKALKNMFNREDDCFFRLGGEEFGVIFKNTTKENSIEYAKDILKNIEDLKIKHKYNSASDYLTLSIGLVCKRANEIANFDLVFKEADDLLYEAKRTGRNIIKF